MKHYFDEHWYDNHPKILEAEKSAMHKVLKNSAKFIIRDDHYACWHIYGDHEMELVYKEDGISVAIGFMGSTIYKNNDIVYI